MNLPPSARRGVLRSRYLVAEEKIDLLEAVAAVQEPILREQSGDRNVAVYVSIPFCPSRCHYCTFPAYRAQAAVMEAYLGVLEEDIGLLVRDIAVFGLRVNAIYIGGGTPTALEPEQLERLLGSLTRVLPPERTVEFCCEAGRPDTLLADKLAILAGAGVNRLCINPQTLDDDTLRRIGRSHSVRDFYRAYELARRTASWRINADMILGLPGEGEGHVERTTRELVKLGMDSITVHYLSLKRGSEMWLNSLESEGAWLPDGMSAGVTERGRAGEDIRRELMGAGYQPYYLYRQKGMWGNMENIGYSSPGAWCLYNIVMISESQHVVGLGAGAAGKIRLGSHGHKNLYCPKDIASYEKKFREMAGIRRDLLGQNRHMPNFVSTERHKNFQRKSFDTYKIRMIQCNQERRNTDEEKGPG